MRVGMQLALLVARGRLSLGDLDQPTPSWQQLERDRVRSAMVDLQAGWPGRRSPVMRYPAATPYRNLAREWIEANPKEWQVLMQRALEEEKDLAETDQARARAA